jgi:GT2 family glycosyltransferase
MTSVAIIVLNWNGINDTEMCVDSLLLQTHKNFSIIVIDNGSTDESLEKLKQIEAEHNNIIVIANSKNKGFAGGVNTGIKYALNKGFDSIALFNNDAVADKDWLVNLEDKLNKNNASVVTSLLVDSAGEKIDSTSEQYSIWGMPFPRSRGQEASIAPDSGYVFGATGGATLYKTSLFKQIGLFDESFFAYYEDVDVSFRAQLAGHKIYYDKDAVAYHKQGATSSKIPGFTVYQTFKNIPLLYIKDVPTSLLLPVGFRLLFLYWLIFGNAIKNGSGKYALKGWLASIWYFWTKSLWNRFYIQSKKTVPTSYIKSLLWYDLPPDQTGMRKLRKKLTGK